MAVAGSLPSGWRTCKRATSPRTRARCKNVSPRSSPRTTGRCVTTAGSASIPCERPAPWAPFGAYRFVLPLRAARRRRGGDAVCNLVLPRDARRHAEILDQVERLSFPRETSDHALPEPVSRRDHPDREGWSRNVERALAAFSEEAGQGGARPPHGARFLTRDRPRPARREPGGSDAGLLPLLRRAGGGGGFRLRLSRAALPPRWACHRERGRGGDQAARRVRGGRR